MSPGPTRRAVLGLAPALLLAACTREEPAPVVVDPDDALRAAAAERERALLRSYDGAGPAFAALRAHHEEHLALLVGPPPSAPPSTAPAPPVDAAGLVAAERAAGAAHAADCLAARDRDLAALLATLSAAELAHAVALA